MRYPAREGRRTWCESRDSDRHVTLNMEERVRLRRYNVNNTLYVPWYELATEHFHEAARHSDLRAAKHHVTLQWTGPFVPKDTQSNPRELGRNRETRRETFHDFEAEIVASRPRR